VIDLTTTPSPSQPSAQNAVAPISGHGPPLIDVGSAFDVTRVVEELHPHGRHVNAIGSHLVLQAGIR
jgi:hypothetical protein